VTDKPKRPHIEHCIDVRGAEDHHEVIRICEYALEMEAALKIYADLENYGPDGFYMEGCGWQAWEIADKALRGKS